MHWFRRYPGIHSKLNFSKMIRHERICVTNVLYIYPKFINAGGIPNPGKQSVLPGARIGQ